MMDKNSAEHIPCTYCSNDAIPGTEPPVCAEHVEETQVKTASDNAPDTLKKLQDAE